MNTLRALAPLSIVLLSTVTAVAGCSQSTEEVGESEGAATQQASTPKVGEYEAKSEARSGTLKITKASDTSLDFELEVYNLFGGYNMGFADGTARGRAGVYTYKAEDCSISFKVSKAAIEIAQQGVCGMGMNVTADGTYTAKAPAPPVASLCAGGESVVFSCKTRGGKLISICSEGDLVQYRFGAPNKVEMKLPAAMASIATKPEVAEGGFISLAGPGAGGAWTTFHNGEYDYSVFTINSSKGIDAEGRSLGLENTSGVVVTQKGKRIGLVKCAEEPTSELPSDLVAASSEPFEIP